MSSDILGVSLPAPSIYGILKINEKSGLFQLTDQTDCDITLDVIFSENCYKENLCENSIVKITKFMACIEVMTIGSTYKWTYLYQRLGKNK